MSKKNRDLSSPFSFLGRDLFFLMKRKIKKTNNKELKEKIRFLQKKRLKRT